MSLRLTGYIELPAHKGKGGFDHADIHTASGRLYVAHTSNNGLDVIDCTRNRYVGSIGGMQSVAGALVSDICDLVFTSNRGENTVSIFTPGSEEMATKVAVGVRPNGLAFDGGRGILIAANVGDPDIAHSFTVSVVDIQRMEHVAEIQVPGRTRWAVFHPKLDMFYVNIAAPARIVAIRADDARAVTAEYEVAAAGPHGLDFDPATGRLFCACDASLLFAIDAASGRTLAEVGLSGAPDVIFLQPDSGRLYVAIGDPGVIDVIDTREMRRVETVKTERGAHTLALDDQRNNVFVFLPETHRAAIYHEEL